MWRTDMDYTTEQWLELKKDIETAFESDEITLIGEDGSTISVLSELCDLIYETTPERIKQNIEERLSLKSDLDSDNYQLFWRIIFDEDIDELALHINDNFRPVVRWRIRQLKRAGITV